MNSSKTESLQSQGGNPTGLIGYLIGKLMNKMHSRIYDKALNNICIPEYSICLDIGCGGGKAIFLINKKHECNKIYGIDHSEQMVKLATRCNETDIRTGKVEIIHTSTFPLDFQNNYFNLITAFETIQFWPEIDNTLLEIYHKLKSGGVFLLANRLPKTGSKWHEFAQIKSPGEYKARLHHAGFAEITIDLESAKGWIIIKGRK